MNQFVDQLHHCRCCPRQCGVDRLAGEVGFCQIGGQALVSHVGLHHGEEPPISGNRGSGTIFFAGCNLRCVFCQNYQISQEFDRTAVTVSDHRGKSTGNALPKNCKRLQGAPAIYIDPPRWSIKRPASYTPVCEQAADKADGAPCNRLPVTPMSTAELALAMLRLQTEGAHNINFVSPTHVIWPMADAILAARDMGLVVPVVYNSNGYDSLEALRQIRGLIDIYLPDLKYLDRAMARDYSKVDDYAEVIGGVLAEMLNQVGHLELDKDGIARRGLLVRHLVLPGGLENSKQCLRLLADLAPTITVSLMSQYSPQYKAESYPAINRLVSSAEYDEITDYALSLGLDNVFVQELSSQDLYLPDFDQDQPFSR